MPTESTDHFVSKCLDANLRLSALRAQRVWLLIIKLLSVAILIGCVAAIYYEKDRYEYLTLFTLFLVSQAWERQGRTELRLLKLAQHLEWGRNEPEPRAA